MKRLVIVQPPDPEGFHRAKVEFGQAIMAYVKAAMRVAERLHALYTLFPPRPNPSWTNEQINTWLFRERP